MSVNRRDMLVGLGGIVAGAALGTREARAGTDAPREQGTAFPRKADFNIAPGYTYISGAYTHPMPIASAMPWL